MTKIAQAMQTRQAAAPANVAPKQSIQVMLNSLLDSDGYRKRFDEILGKRAPQFVSSIVSLVNADNSLQEAFMNAPVTIIQSALKAATFDLPIDKSLGYAYIVPFRSKGKMEAQFIMGYKGMLQLALRTGVYKVINVTDVKEGELKHFDRLTEEIEIDFIEDEEQREKMPAVGWVGYFRMVNGTEKTIYMSRAQVEAHELKHRKGNYMGQGWQRDFDAMARKTVLRRLIGTWGLMSIDYQKADMATVQAAEAIAKGQYDDEDVILDPEYTVSEEDAAIVAELDAEMAQQQMEMME